MLKPFLLLSALLVLLVVGCAPSNNISPPVDEADKVVAGDIVKVKPNDHLAVVIQASNDGRWFVVRYEDSFGQFQTASVRNFEIEKVVAPEEPEERKGWIRQHLPWNGKEPATELPKNE